MEIINNFFCPIFFRKFLLNEFCLGTSEYQSVIFSEKRLVEEVLYDNLMEVAIKPVKTLSLTSYGRETQLRTTNLNIDYSQKYKDAFGISSVPVVMAGGIYTSLDAFDEFGRDLVEEGHDVYLIEITGGPDSEDNTPYTYEDLEDYYVPSLIAGVQHYSGSDKINYVGHSNGCRSALTSLSKHHQGEDNIGYIFNYKTGIWELVDLVANPVDKFFGIACPTTLNELEYTSDNQRKLFFFSNEKTGDRAIRLLKEENKINIYQEDFVEKVSHIYNLGSKEFKISLNLQEFYNNLAIDELSSFSGNQNAANRYIFFAGIDNYGILPDYGGDGVVPLQDLELLNDTFENSELSKFAHDHTDIQSANEVEDVIRGKLK